MPTVTRTWSALTCVATALLAGAPSARAAVLTTDRACYREGEPVLLGGGAFTPNGQVDVARDGLRLPSPFLADAAGSVAGRFAAPAVGRAVERPFRVDASDRARPARTGSVTPLVSLFGVSLRPARAGPGHRRRITARGFTGGGTLYAHVARRRARRTVRIGRLGGACGTLSARKRILRRGARRGTYSVQFDTRRAYGRRTVPRAVYRVRVGRLFRGRGSAAGP